MGFLLVTLSSYLPARETVALHAVTGPPVNIEPWQVINIVGAPLVALAFLPLVVRDLGRWIQARREVRVRSGRPPRGRTR